MRRKTIKLHSLKTVVLDEADEMLDMGFIKDVTGILERAPEEKTGGYVFRYDFAGSDGCIRPYQRDVVEITVLPKEESKPK